MKLLVSMLLGLLLSGCVSMYSYQEPASGPRARVRFVALSLSTTVLRKYDDSQCLAGEEEMMRLRVGSILWGSNTGPRQIGIPLWHYKGDEAKEAYVDSSKPFNGMFFGSEKLGNSLDACAVEFTFQPEAGKDYEVVYDYLNPALGKGNTCTVNAYEIARKPDASYARRLVPVERSQAGTCWKAFYKRRVY